MEIEVSCWYDERLDISFLFNVTMAQQFSGMQIEYVEMDALKKILLQQVDRGAIDTVKALDIPLSETVEPTLVACYDGVFSIVIDGWHRLYRAYHDGQTAKSVALLTVEQTLKCTMLSLHGEWGVDEMLRVYDALYKKEFSDGTD